VDNKASDDELEIGESVQRDIPEIASPPPEIGVFDIYGDNRGKPPSREGKEEKVEEVSKPPYTYIYMMYGLIIVIIALCISTGFLYSEVKESQYIINELNATNNQRIQRIEAINNELGYKINELNRTFDQRIEKISQDIALQQPLQPTNGVIELDKKRYSIGERANVIVKDADMNTNTSERNVVSVIVKNIKEEQQIAINLVEITENSGVFTGKFILMKKTDEGVSGIGVNINDTIIAVYYDQKTADGPPCDVVTLANVTKVKI